MKKIHFLALLIALITLLIACQSETSLDDPSTSGTQAAPSSESTVSTAPTAPPASSAAADISPMSWQDALRLIHLETRYHREPVASEEIEILDHGTYGQKHVAFIQCPCWESGSPYAQVIGGHLFCFGNGYPLYTYMEGTNEAYSLREAYGRGWFTQDELQDLYSNYRQQYSDLYDLNVSGLSWQDAMKTTVMWMHGHDSRPLDTVKIEEYGSYGDNHVAFVSCDCFFTSAITEKEIGGFLFIYSSSQELTVYRDGVEYVLPLSAAWEAGWFTEEELSQLHAVYKDAKPFLYMEG